MDQKFSLFYYLGISIHHFYQHSNYIRNQWVIFIASQHAQKHFLANLIHIYGFLSQHL